jgi:hypothetical protein
MWCIKLEVFGKMFGSVKYDQIFSGDQTNEIWVEINQFTRSSSFPSSGNYFVCNHHWSHTSSKFKQYLCISTLARTQRNIPKRLDKRN